MAVLDRHLSAVSPHQEIRAVLGGIFLGNILIMLTRTIGTSVISSNHLNKAGQHIKTK